MELTEQDRVAFGRAMGMKAREILAAEAVAGGYVVTTHDHQRTFVDEHGRVGGRVAAPVAPPVGFPSPVAAEPEQSGSVSQTQDPGSSGAGGPGGPKGEVEVPDGSEREVLAWVDGDPVRAAAALRAEEARETPRKGLAAKLRDLAV